VSDPLPADLAEALAHAPELGDYARLRYYAEVESTNDLALALAASGEREGSAVLADMQRAGRGRRGRVWFSPPGAGMYLSIVVRLGQQSESLSLVTLAAGVAVARAVTTVTHLPVELKWPNDLVLGRPWRKLGGLLCESAGSGSRIDAVVIGIGLNLLSLAYPAEMRDRATSIEAELGRPVSRAAIVTEVLAEVRDGIDRLRRGGHDWVLQNWRRFGQVGLDAAPVRWQEHGEWRRGIARDIDSLGALVVERDGRLEHLVAGEVLWERLSRE
jgi:BirA family biotin operon repressor/biotin-[acetyl-CoA-carboxylase] ligase